ncbi:MAG: SEC-C metal-binding domain-containing protein, partial [Acidimicrobiia bacterium]
DEPMQVMVKAIRAGQTASPVMAYMAQRDAAFAAAVAKAGRNDPCPCGSGVKTKRCHGAGQPESAERPQMPSGPGRPRARVGTRSEERGGSS